MNIRLNFFVSRIIKINNTNVLRKPILKLNARVNRQEERKIERKRERKEEINFTLDIYIGVANGQFLPLPNAIFPFVGGLRIVAFPLRVLQPATARSAATAHWAPFSPASVDGSRPGTHVHAQLVYAPLRTDALCFFSPLSFSFSLRKIFWKFFLARI